MTVETEDATKREERLAHLAQVVSQYAEQKRLEIQNVFPNCLARMLALLDGLKMAIEEGGPEATHAISSQTRETTNLGYENEAQFAYALGARITKTMLLSDFGGERAEVIMQQHNLKPDDLSRIVLRVGRLGSHIDRTHPITFYEFVLDGRECAGLILDIRAKPAIDNASYFVV